LSNKIRLGILEFGPSLNIDELVKNVIDYSIAAEDAGFSRFWLGEHYLSRSVWYNPEVLLPIIAGSTNKIKIGVGGTLLAFHNPYRLLLAFKLLNNLFPNRIDLGIAKGGALPEIQNLLIPNLENKIFSNQNFNSNLETLLSLLNNKEGQLINGAPLIPPYYGINPEIWYLSLNIPNNISLPLLKNVNFCKSMFHVPNISIDDTYGMLERFRENYLLKLNKTPEIILAFSGICHETTRKAKNLETRLGNDHSISTYNELIGCPNYFFDTISSYSEKFKVNEFLFLNKAFSLKDKSIALNLISRKFNLS